MKLAAVRDRYRDSLLRTTIASTASMTNHDKMAELTLKNDTTIESRKMAGMVSPLIRKNRTVAGA